MAFAASGMDFPEKPRASIAMWMRFGALPGSQQQVADQGAEVTHAESLFAKGAELTGACGSHP